MNQLTFGSLFAGIGGFDLGFERAGMVCKWQVEIDEYANRVLAKHWPNVRRWPDVRTWPQPDTERVDVICGGFPCQDISYAGQGAGLDGERSGLFFEAVRVVRELQPRIVVLENVAALLARGLDRVLGTLAEIGYDAEWHCIPAAAVGAPFIRDRVFVVATPCGLDTLPVLREFLLHESRDARTRLPVPSGGRVADGPVCDWDDRDGSESDGERRKEFNAARVATGTRRACGMAVAAGDQWRIEPAVGRVAHGVPNRVDRLRGLGNAVVPQVAEWIGRRIIEAVEAVNPS